MIIAALLSAAPVATAPKSSVTLVGETIYVMDNPTGRGLHQEKTASINGPISVIQSDGTDSTLLLETPTRRFWTFSSSVDLHSQRPSPPSVLTPCRTQATGTQGTRGSCGETKKK